MDNSIILAVIENMVDKLNHRVGHGADAVDLHHHLCNEDYFIIGTYNAKKFLGEHAFDAIGVIKEYEEDNFGNSTTDFSNPEKVANMLAYIIGQHVLNLSKHYSDIMCEGDGGEKLTKECIHRIRTELKKVNVCCVKSQMEGNECFEEAA